MLHAPTTETNRQNTLTEKFATSLAPQRMAGISGQLPGMPGARQSLGNQALLRQGNAGGGQTSPLIPLRPSQGMGLQRKCACGGSTGPAGECAECKANLKTALRRKAAGATGPAVAPPIVHHVLRSSGQALDKGTRALMEPRFGQDFSGVRVHTDAKAAESARAVSARAYTVGRNVVFGAGEYAPGSRSGQELLAHELTHVAQQGAHSTLPADLPIGDANSPLEQEADMAATHLSAAKEQASPDGSHIRPRISRAPMPIIRRWNISGDTATSDTAGTDTLGTLATKIGAHALDWKCIKPVKMKTFDTDEAISAKGDHYELYVQPSDQFDISNLTAKTGQSLWIYLFDDTTQVDYAKLAKLFYPGIHQSSLVDSEIAAISGEGATPIDGFLIFGHQSGGAMYGTPGANDFSPAAFDPEDPAPTYTRASQSLFPRRCWFTRNAFARSVGCVSENWGIDFAAKFLRVGASVRTTTKSVRPACDGPYLIPGTTNCRSFNALDFADSSSSNATRLDGPFYNQHKFHAAPFWKTLPGKL